MAHLRLQRFVADRWGLSRRAADEAIFAGRVTVNGQPAEHPDQAVDPEGDAVRLDGRRPPPPPPRQVLLMYKPRGVVVTLDDPEDRRTVMDLLPPGSRVRPVGRLDIQTEGALLLTNDGKLAHGLTHPSRQVPRRYLAKVWRTPTEKTLSRIQRGIRLADGGRTGPCKARVLEVTEGGNAWVEITVTEGRHHLVRRLLATVNHPVSKLRRVSFGSVGIRGMAPGEVRPVTPEELARLEAYARGRRPPPPRRGRSRASKGGRRRRRAGGRRTRAARA